MRRAIFVAVLMSACSSANSTGGTQGNVDFSYMGAKLTTTDKPIALGTDATIQVKVHSATLYTNATFDSQAPAVLRIDSSARGPRAGEWFLIVNARSEGTSRISVGDGAGKVVDTIDLKASAIAKFELPSSADVGVAKNVAVEIKARNALGDELFAPAAIDWSVDHPEVVQFWDSVRNTTQASTSGTSLQIHGVALGSAVLHGVYGKTAVSVPVTVK